MWINLAGAETPGHSYPNASCHLEYLKKQQKKPQKPDTENTTESYKKNGTASNESPNRSDGFDLATERKLMQNPVSVTLWKAEHGRVKTHMGLDYPLKNGTIAQSYLSSEFINTPEDSTILMFRFVLLCFQICGAPNKTSPSPWERLLPGTPKRKDTETRGQSNLEEVGGVPSLETHALS